MPNIAYRCFCTKYRELYWNEFHLKLFKIKLWEINMVKRFDSLELPGQVRTDDIMNQNLWGTKELRSLKNAEWLMLFADHFCIYFCGLAIVKRRCISLREFCNWFNKNQGAAKIAWKLTNLTKTKLGEGALNLGSQAKSFDIKNRFAWFISSFVGFQAGLVAKWHEWKSSFISHWRQRIHGSSKQNKFLDTRGASCSFHHFVC